MQASAPKADKKQSQGQNHTTEDGDICHFPIQCADDGARHGLFNLSRRGTDNAEE